MKFNIYSLTLGIIALFLINSCSKDALDYRNYLNDAEKTYPGLPKQIQASPGNYRVKLSWHPSPDPTVTEYRIFWNNSADSIQFMSNNHNPAETISKIIDKLNEYDYSFVIYSYDQKGNRSVPVTINNVKVYGDSYSESLTNRFINLNRPYVLNDDGLTLYFDKPDTVNTGTEIKYTRNNNSEVSINLDSGQTSILLPNYKKGTSVYYKSSYKPSSFAMDIRQVSHYDSLTNIVAPPLDKSLFAEVHLPNDVGSYDGASVLSKIWTGNTSPEDYPKCFASDGSQNLPHHFTFDMGKVYIGISQFEIIGRGGDGYHNPIKFEVWGIANLTNAATTKKGNDSGWPAEMREKGWTLLGDITRPDNGQAPFKVDFADNDVPVRYIRMRIKSVNSGSSNSSNISEVSLWRK